MQQGNSRENCKNYRVKYGAGAGGHWPFFLLCMGQGEGIKRQESLGEGIKIRKKLEERM